MKSACMELNKEDWKRIIRQIAIIYWPVWLLCLQQLDTWNFDYKVLWALALSITFDIGRRYLKDYIQEAKDEEEK